MKTVKRIFALVLVLMMVLTMTVAVSAEEPKGTITIINQQDGQTYDVYRMFEWVETENTGVYWYKINDAWKSFNADGTYFELDENGFLISLNKSESEIATAAKTYAGNVIATYADVTTDAVTDAQYGYYLLVSSLGDRVAMGTLNSDAGLILREKNMPEGELPTVNKTITDAAGTVYKVGDTIHFQIEIECEENAATYTVHDLMQGMTLNEDSINVVINNSDITVNKTVYNPKSENSDACEDECTFEIVLTMAGADGVAVKAYDKITVTYNATITEDSVSGMSNKAWIEEADSEIKVETDGFIVTKTDSQSTTIDGAEFKLYSDADCTVEVQLHKVEVRDAEGNITGAYYRPANTNESVAVIEAGVANIKGLVKDETYYLKETKAPVGYQLLTEATKVDLNTMTAVSIQNTEMSALPETGGVGTTIFYIVGGLLVMAAVVLLATKKHVNTQ